LERQRAYEAISTLGITGGNEVVAMMDPENNGFVTHDVFSDIALSAMVRVKARTDQCLLLPSLMHIPP
jgi:hypothetical protein